MMLVSSLLLFVRGGGILCHVINYLRLMLSDFCDYQPFLVLGGIGTWSEVGGHFVMLIWAKIGVAFNSFYIQCVLELL